jgi:manganese/zinc/iron transport system permease protein
MGGVLLLNVLFIGVLYKELKLTTFDTGLAAALGFAPTLLHYAFMTLVSITAVGAFNAVGSILVVALMITPPSTAYLLTHRLGHVIILSVLIGAASALAGFWSAWLMDASIAGCMAAAAGLFFMLAFLLAPDQGVVAVARRKRRQRWEFARAMLAIHLLHHEGTPEAVRESNEKHLGEHLRWDSDFARRVVREAQEAELIEREPDGRLLLTTQGRDVAQRVMAN